LSCLPGVSTIVIPETVDKIPGHPDEYLGILPGAGYDRSYEMIDDIIGVSPDEIVEIFCVSSPAVSKAVPPQYEPVLRTLMRFTRSFCNNRSDRHGYEGLFADGLYESDDLFAHGSSLSLDGIITLPDPEDEV
jgi:hypothetical protein